MTHDDARCTTPAMSIADNVTAGFRLSGTEASTDEKNDLIEECLSKAGLWNEVRIDFASPAVRCQVASSSRCASRGCWRCAVVLLMDGAPFGAGSHAPGPSSEARHGGAGASATAGAIGGVLVALLISGALALV